MKKYHALLLTMVLGLALPLVGCDKPQPSFSSTDSVESSVETHVHSLTLVRGKHATCTEEGHSAYYKCSTCDKIFADDKGRQEITLADVVIAKIDHNLVFVEATPACEKDGTIAHFKCKACGQLFADESCEKVLTEEDIVVPIIGHHKLTKVERVEPTCAKEGNIEYYVCEDCDKLFLDAEGKNPTTAEEVVLKTTDKHDVTFVEAVEATEEHDGNVAHYLCSVCGRTFKDEACTQEIEDVTTKFVKPEEQK